MTKHILVTFSKNDLCTRIEGALPDEAKTFTTSSMEKAIARATEILNLSEEISPYYIPKHEIYIGEDGYEYFRSTPDTDSPDRWTKINISKGDTVHERGLHCMVYFRVIEHLG